MTLYTCTEWRVEPADDTMLFSFSVVPLKVSQVDDESNRKFGNAVIENVRKLVLIIHYELAKVTSALPHYPLAPFLFLHGFHDLFSILFL